MAVIDQNGDHHVIVDNLPEQKPREMYRATFRTIQLNANNQSAPIVDGPDDARVSVTIIAIDAPVVLGDKNQAKDGANTTTSIPNPVGAIIPINVAVPIPAQTEVSAACPLTGVNINRISVITVHRVAQ